MMRQAISPRLAMRILLTRLIIVKQCKQMQQLKINKMEFFIDPNFMKTAKPLGVAALGIAAFASMFALMIAIAYLFNKYSNDEEGGQDEHYDEVDRKKKPAGIYNQGNTCFVNSLLQALAPLKSFVSNLKELTQFSQGKSNPHEQLLIELKSSLQNINRSQQSIEITKFLSAIGNFSQIINMQQQDAYELFSIIVNSLQHVYNQNKRESLNRSTLSADSNELEENFVNCSVSLQKEDEVRNTLLGYTKSSIVCQGCREQINIKIHPFYNLSFDISQNRIRTLEDALHLFQEKQYIQGWICTNCSIQQHLRKLAKVKQEIKEKSPAHAELLIQICGKIETFLAKKSQNQLEMHEINCSLGDFVKKFQKEYLEIGDKNDYRDQVFLQISPVTQKIVKQSVISKFPKVLVIHLKQLSISPITGQPVLLRKYIDFPKNLQIPVKKGKKNYELVSLISHSGNESFGHYFTFRKLNSGTQNWFFISDTTSKECKQEFLKVHMPYMLFYELAQE